MAQPFPVRRAAIYRQRAHELSESAKQPRDECDRKHMLDQAAAFERAADALAPTPPPEPPPRHLSGIFKGLFDPPRVKTNVPQISKERTASVVRAERVRVDPAEAEQRFAERDQREAADTRTEAQRWLGDPPADRSALTAKR